MTTRVSALLPVRDAVATLRSAVESLRVQTRPVDEIVIVDDGSSDGSLDLAGELAESDPRIRLVARSASGLVPALNAGLAACTGAWILRMDADDLCHRGRLAAQLELVERAPELAVVGCAVRVFPRRGRGEGLRLYERWLNSLTSHADIAREAFVESPIAHPSVMVRADVLRTSGGWHDTPWPEDYDLWLRLLQAGHRFGKAPAGVLLWRDGAARLTRTDSRYSRARFLQAKAHYLASGPLAGGDAVVIWGAGRIGGQLARLLEQDHGIAVEAFVDIDPRKIGSTRRGRPVVSPADLPHLRARTLLAAVGRRGARELIRARLREQGRVEGEDYWVVA